MFNKKIKKTIALTLLLSLSSSNMAFAELMNLNGSDPTVSTGQNTGDKLNIVKAMTTKKTTVVKDLDKGPPIGAGNAENGNNGVTIAAAYITANKKFGLMYVNKYNYQGHGTVVAYSDALSSDPWNFNESDESGRFTQTWPSSNNRMFAAASEYFTTSAAIKKSLTDVTAKDVEDGKHLIQTASNGDKFIATTLYVRYTYDIDDKHNLDSEYLMSKPILEGNFKDGPYFAINEFFDAKLNVIEDGNDAILANPSSYIKPIHEMTGGKITSSIVGLTKDYSPMGSYGELSTKKAVFEKRFEYRRYLTSEKVQVVDKENFEVVYPKTNTVKVSQVALPDIAPKINLTAETVYNATRTDIEKYVFNFSFKTRAPRYTYSNTGKTYIIRSEADKITNEPGESQMDFWHSDAVLRLDVVDKNGNSRLKNPIPIGLSDTTATIYPSNIKEDASGSLSLDDCTATLVASFKNNARFMANKNIYTTNYTLNGKDVGYNTVIEYIDTKDSTLRIKSEVSNFQTQSDPRVEKIYKTTTTKTLTTKATADIFAVTLGDFVKPRVTVDIDPPNALTVLEGGEFGVDVNINTGTIPIGDESVETWLSDFMLDEVKVQSASGDTILKKNDIPIQPTEIPYTIDTVSFPNLTANPNHIGKATVTATYSYILNRKITRTTPKETGEFDENGDVIWEYETTTELVKTPQNGIAKNYFNIYSLSGNTIN